jgi:GNAT superfamily N-acetyltransferase
MLDAVSQWARELGMELLRGPVNPSTNHECGLLIEGFTKRPRFMMTYNPSYYPQLLASYGLTKAKDLTAWDAEAANLFSDRFTRIAERQRRRADITVRELRMRDFDQEIELIREIYNNAWERNWGFVPMDEIEFRYMAKQMRLVLDPRLCLIAHARGVPAAFGLALPNINQVFEKIRSGRLFPFGIFALAWYLLGPGRKSAITECRILTLGIRKEFRSLGLGSLLYFEYLKRAPAAGMNVAEASWILEDNADMVASLESAHAHVTSRYRVYEKPLS